MILDSLLSGEKVTEGQGDGIEVGTTMVAEGELGNAVLVANWPRIYTPIDFHSKKRTYLLALIRPTLRCDFRRTGTHSMLFPSSSVHWREQLETWVVRFRR